MSKGSSGSLAALAVGGAIALAGCGSSAPSKAQYQAKADAICRDTRAQTAPLISELTAAAQSLSAASRSSAGELDSTLRQLHTTASGSLAKLRALAQPTGGHATIERFLGAFASIVGALDQAAASAQAGHLQQALAQLAAAESASRQLASAAKDYGMADCETILSVSALGASAGAGALKATLVGEDHDPIVGRPWRYTITVTSAQGEKLSGTETTHYAFNGVVVGTEKPENVSFTDGVYRDTIEFPAAAVGYPLQVQVIVHAGTGSATLDWPVLVGR
jgi:hypothetical protein